MTALSVDGPESPAAEAPGTIVVYRAPISPRPTTRPATLVSRRRRFERRRASAAAAGLPGAGRRRSRDRPAGPGNSSSGASDEAFGVDTGSLLDQVDRGEEPDPHDVDEVPV